MKKKPQPKNWERYWADQRELGKKCIVCGELMPRYKVYYCSYKCGELYRRKLSIKSSV